MSLVIALARIAVPFSWLPFAVGATQGSPASPCVYSDLARTLVEAGFVVAMPEHLADNYKDDSEPGPPEPETPPVGGLQVHRCHRHRPSLRTSPEAGQGRHVWDVCRRTHGADSGGRAPVVPLGLVSARQDIWLNPEYHSDVTLKACSSCVRLDSLPTGGHGALLSPLPPGRSGLAAELISDPPGFDRAASVLEVNRKISSFFVKHLLSGGQGR
jgi:hypothetical protein